MARMMRKAMVSRRWGPGPSKLITTVLGPGPRPPGGAGLVAGPASGGPAGGAAPASAPSAVAPSLGISFSADLDSGRRGRGRLSGEGAMGECRARRRVLPRLDSGHRHGVDQAV